MGHRMTGTVTASDRMDGRIESAGGSPRLARNATLPTALARYWPALLVVLGLALWLLGLREVRPAELDGFGLIKHLSPATLIAYPIVLAGAVGELRRPYFRGWLLGLSTAVTVLMVYGLQPATQSAGRLPVAWLHAGFTEYIAKTGSVLPDYDTRFSWPGFFTAAAFICRAAGITNPADLLNWTPVVFAGVGVLAFRALAGSVFPGSRVTWIATWIFLLANWTEQDYFSPQGTTVVLFLGALAVTMRYLVSPSIVRGGRVRLADRPVPLTSARNRIWAQLVVLALAIAIAPSHQLTPFVLAGMLLILLLWGRLRSGWLPFLAFLAPLAWFVLGARSFWISQLDRITGAVGDLDSSVSKGIGQRVAGDAGHQVLVIARIGITFAVFALALWGILVLRRRGMRSWALPALAVAPFGLAVVQPYGGEVFVRCYLFALPWLALAAGVAVTALLEKDRRSAIDTDVPQDLPATGRPIARGVVSAVLATVLLTVLGLTTVAARSGNDAYVGVTEADVQGMQLVYRTAAPGDVVVAPLWYSPLRSGRINDLRQVNADALAAPGKSCDTPATIISCIEGSRVRFVVVDPQQESAGRILDGFPEGWSRTVVAELTQHGYRTIYDRNGSMVLERLGSSG
jgi:hypothetical protein